MHAPPAVVHAALLSAAHSAAATLLGEVAAFDTALREDPFAPVPTGLQEALNARRDALATLGAAVARSWATIGALAAPPPPAAEDRLPAGGPDDGAEEDVAEGDGVPVAATATPTAPAATAVPASAEHLHALRMHFAHAPAGPARHAPQPNVAGRPAAARPQAQDAVATLGPVKPLTDAAAAQTALACVLACIEARESWPRPLRRELLAAVVARLRTLQDECGFPVDPTSLDTAFHCLTDWSKREQPGFVWGLSRHHRPRCGSWKAEAEAAWAELQTPEDAADAKARSLRAVREAASGGVTEILVHAIHAALSAGVRPSDPSLLQPIEPAADALRASGLRLHRAVRTALADWMQDNEQSVAESDRRAPIDPAVLAFCAGKSVLVIGGEGAAHARERLKVAFGFAALHWHPAWERSRAATLREAALASRHDLVIFIARFSSHALSDLLMPALRESGLPVAFVHTGYGVPQVAKAIAGIIPPPDAR